jgi:hypothetical protein
MGFEVVAFHRAIALAVHMAVTGKGFLVGRKAGRAFLQTVAGAVVLVVAWT